MHTLGGDTVAYALIGSAEQDKFTELAARDGYVVASVPIAQPTRNNLTLVSSPPEPLRVARRRAGFPAYPTTMWRSSSSCSGRRLRGRRGLVQRVAAEGFRPSAWAEAAERIRAHGAKLFADVQGDAMIALFETRLVYASKPNQQEALELLPAGEDEPPVQLPSPRCVGCANSE